MIGNKVINEERRLFRLHQYQILDTGTEKAFEDLAHLAAELCETPLAAISLVDSTRQWFKARVGFSISETQREVSFCNHTIRQTHLVEFKDVHKDDRFRHFPFVVEAPNVRFYAAMPLISSDGEAVGSICVMDTKVRELNATQRYSLEKLGRQVIYLLELRYQILALEEAYEESQKALKAKAELLGFMSHEFRTPLSGMLGMVQCLRQHSLGPEQQELVSTIQFSAESLLSITNDILDNSKLNAHKLELEKVDFNLEETLKQMCSFFSVGARQKGLYFQTAVYEKIPLVKGDPLRVRQVLTNLLGNAVKFTDSGSVKLEVSPVMETENYITLKFKVKDTGIGITAEQQKIIFDEYRQASTDISRKFGGTGLGLSITKNLLRLMESEIQVKSEPNHGSEFVFTLSFQKSRESVLLNNPVHDITGANFAGKKILLTEDNEVNELIALNFLKKWGLEVEVAKNGKEAVVLAEKKHFDLILMDLQMPEMDGFEATRKIRSLGDYYKKVPVIALTASAVLEVKQKAFEAGVSDFLMKPYNPDKLYQVLKIELSREQGATEEQLQSRINIISGEDADFKKELTRLYLKSFREIQAELEEGRLTKVKNLRQLRHKHKSTFQLLQLEDLMKTFTNLQKQLEMPRKDKKEIAKSLDEISSLIEHVVCDLEKLG